LLFVILPGDLLTLDSLVNASFAGNELYGSLPTSGISKSLSILELYSNKLSGSLSALTSATSLTIADLHFNLFEDSLPELPETLQYISVANNHLTGSIPHQWSSLKNLGTIGLAYNSFTGGLAALAAMPALKVIFLRNNSFTGAFPAVPMGLGALYLDANQGITSVDMSSICASAPAGGWHEGGCAAVSGVSIICTSRTIELVYGL
jgi:Leucine-rich repeat (LRR) protein